MNGASAPPDSLKPLRLLWILAVMSLLFVAALAIAPVRPYFAEWRSVQKDYNRLAATSGAKPIAIGLKQIWKPALGVVDRCTTCHLGMAGAATPVAGHALFGPHPPIPHDPREFGCTVCHGGQGRATTARAAHGFVSHWDEQMLEQQDVSAGCGTCHDQFPTAPRRVLTDGAHLVERLDCLSCHRLDGRGRGDAPDLTAVGLKGFNTGWHADHLAKHQAGASAAWRASYGPVAGGDLKTLERFLATRVGAARIVEARALAMERGCLGCHKLGGIGGDEGPALDAVGRKPVGDLSFAHVPGAQTFTNYMRAHLLDPAKVFPGSTMLAQDYATEEVGLLTSWILSQRSRAVPPAFLPTERVRRDLLHQARVPWTAEQNFGAFCSACHGPRGEGRTVGSSEVRFPAIGSPDVLNVASDEFIVRTITTGRPGRRMPALAGPNGSLDSTDVAAIVAFLRAPLRAAPSLADLNAAMVDPEIGRQAYHDQCATCHGESGEGTPLGSPLAAADRPRGAERDYEALVHGVRGTAMPAYADREPAVLAAVLKHIGALPRQSVSRALDAGPRRRRSGRRDLRAVV